MEHASTRLGWIGTGRMGAAMARRLLAAGCDLAVYNRTRAKAEPLGEAGAVVVDTILDLADRDVVFTMVSASADLESVTLGPDGLLGGDRARPGVLVDCSTISAETSATVRAAAAKAGTLMLAAPVSGNPAVVDSGELGLVTSGPLEAHERVEPYLRMIGATVTYVGDAEQARFAKICHNLLLGITTQALAEVLVLAERSGVSRADLLEFLNGSVLGSRFSRYKTPGLIALDFTPTFTSVLMRKDFDIGLATGRALEVALPVSTQVRELLQSLVGHGHGEDDFAALLLLEAMSSGAELRPEPVTA